jgi:predicted dehydrogenase
MDSIRIAVVGCGGIFSAHWEGYQEQLAKGFDDFELVAFCDLVEEKARDYADKYLAATGKQAKVFTSVEEMLASDADFQVVSLQVPHAVHHTLAIRCLNAGKHVMTEKPLGITMRAAKRMMEAAKANGVTLKVMENTAIPSTNAPRRGRSNPA